MAPPRCPGRYDRLRCCKRGPKGIYWVCSLVWQCIVNGSPQGAPTNRAHGSHGGPMMWVAFRDQTTTHDVLLALAST
jgi:hypothetical protein